MNLVLTGAGRLVEVQATAEQQPFDESQLQQLLALGRQGVETLMKQQKAAVPLRAAVRR